MLVSAVPTAPAAVESTNGERPAPDDRGAERREEYIGAPKGHRDDVDDEAHANVGRATQKLHALNELMPARIHLLAEARQRRQRPDAEEPGAEEHRVNCEGPRQANGRSQNASERWAEREHRAERDAVERVSARDHVLRQDATNDGPARGHHDGAGDRVDRRDDEERPHRRVTAVAGQVRLPHGQHDEPEHRRPGDKRRNDEHAATVKDVREHASPQARDDHRDQGNPANEANHEGGISNRVDLQPHGHGRDEGSDPGDQPAYPQAREGGARLQRSKVNKVTVAGRRLFGRVDVRLVWGRGHGEILDAP